MNQLTAILNVLETNTESLHHTLFREGPRCTTQVGVLAWQIALQLRDSAGLRVPNTRHRLRRYPPGHPGPRGPELLSLFNWSHSIKPTI